MTFREPAGEERGGGRSAEFFVPAGAEDGAAGKTRRTVCGKARRGAICLQNFGTLCARELSVEASLYRFSFCQKTVRRIIV